MISREVVRGALGFGAVSVAAFSVWAFGGRKIGNEILMYALIAAVFLGLSGLLLHPLAGSVRRFYLTFVPAFLAYAVVWSLVWFAGRNRLSEWAASAAGCAVFAAVFSWRRPSRIPGLAVVLFLTHSVGYFLGGDVCYAWNHSVPSMLAWGLFYGLGFGAGLGHAYREARPA